MAMSDYIAAAAALIALLALITSIWQRKLTIKHNKLSAKPSIEISRHNPENGIISLQFANNGPGAAAINLVCLVIGGTRYKVESINDLNLVYNLLPSDAHPFSCNHTIAKNSCLPSGGTIKFIEIKLKSNENAEQINQKLIKAIDAISIEVGYSCLYGDSFISHYPVAPQIIKSHSNHQALPTPSRKKEFLSNFGIFMFMTFLLFFLTVGLGKASADLVVYMNNDKTHKTTGQWLMFSIGAFIATAIWCALLITFKKVEKKCLDLLDK